MFTSYSVLSHVKMKAGHEMQTNIAVSDNLTLRSIDDQNCELVLIVHNY